MVCVLHYKGSEHSKRERLAGQVTVGKNKYGKYCLRFVDAETVPIKSSDGRVRTDATCDPYMSLSPSESGENGSNLIGMEKDSGGEGSCEDLPRLKSQLGSFCGYEFGKDYRETGAYSPLRTKYLDFFDRVSLIQDRIFGGKRGLVEVVVMGSMDAMTADQARDKYQSILKILKAQYEVEFVKKGNSYVFSSPDRRMQIRVGPTSIP